MHIVIAGGGVTATAAEPGWDAMQLRVLYNLAVGWFNSFLLTRAASSPDAAQWAKAHDAAERVIEYAPAASSAISPGMAEQFGSAATFVHASIVAEGQRPPAVAGPCPKFAVGSLVDRLVSVSAAYDRACWFAATDDYPAALHDLATAAQVDDVRTWALEDPSLAALHDDPGFGRRFRATVGNKPADTFLDLPALAPARDKLTAAGLTGATELAGTSAAWLSRRLAVSPAVAQGWIDLAVLAATPRANRTVLGMQVIHLLLLSGIASTTALDARLQASVTTLVADLGSAGRNYDIDLPSTAAVSGW